MPQFGLWLAGKDVLLAKRKILLKDVPIGFFFSQANVPQANPQHSL
jgi:hypothetical protein